MLQEMNKMMTSREIAEITGKRPANVMRDIKKMERAYTEVFGDELKFELVKYKARNGEMKHEYSLTKSQALFIVSGYNATLRAKIQARWEELEQQLNIPTTFAGALRLAAEQAEALEVKTLELNAASELIRVNEPKVVLANSIMGSGNSILVRQFAKDLCDGEFKIGQNALFNWFRENKYLNDANEPYQQYINTRVFEVVTTSLNVLRRGKPKVIVRKQTKITGKGQVYFAKKIKGL